MFYTIKIPKPCSEKWDEMTSSQKGKFCSKCKKEVINFQFYSDQHLLDNIKKSDNICGRFLPHQINKELQPTGKNIFNRIALFFTITFIFLAKPSFSQNKKDKIEIVENSINNSKLKNIKNDYVEINGKVVEKSMAENSKSYPLPGVSIIQLGTENNVNSDINGNFKIKIPSKYFNRKITLAFSYIGMERKEIEVTNTTKELKVEMSAAEQLMGEVIIVKRKKKTIFRSVGNLFK
ncbi:MAG: carboxypeptidase-like regulatory domain-containing protein [Flavobacteriaceae bacterium]|nr:carboxypeptidase-like regulatory domain-containing protein [Bacteroidota bacterium]MBX9889358.1 carboxypeptidase-like regulatory domain-containing protein [Flavobacteriaceae bacterium]